MQIERIQVLATKLAGNRASGSISVLSFDDIRNVSDAVAVQSAATAAYTRDVVGYTVIGTSAAACRSLGLDRPVFGTIPVEAFFPDDPSPFRLPQGIIGAQCEFVFTAGAAFLEEQGAIGRRTVEKGILNCRAGIGLVGRRSSGTVPSRFQAIADYALHVATICGRHPPHVDVTALDTIAVHASIDGNEIVHAPANTVMGHPLNAVVWLANELLKDGIRINPGDIIATGSCTPILQVLPGQRLDVEMGPLGPVACTFG